MMKYYLYYARSTNEVISFRFTLVTVYLIISVQQDEAGPAFVSQIGPASLPAAKEWTKDSIVTSDSE